jgi:RHS repeat-associated protein
VSCVYHWDAENRLIAVKDTNNVDIVSYTYDSQSRRVARTQGSNITLYIYDAWNCLAEYTLLNSSFNLHNSFSWGLDLSGSLQGAGGVGGLLAVTKHQEQSTTHFYPTYDGNGNVSEYLDATGSTAAHYEYDPFGRIIVATGADAADFAYRFSTKPADPATGLYYYGYRWFDPYTGRWPSRDPIEESGGVNLYGFVGNDGVDFVDQIGLDRFVVDWWGSHHPYIILPETEWLREQILHKTVNVRYLINDLQREIDENQSEEGRCGTVGEWMRSESYRNMVESRSEETRTEVKYRCNYTGRWIRIDFAAWDTMYTAAYIERYSVSNPEIEILAHQKNFLNLTMMYFTGRIGRPLAPCVLGEGKFKAGVGFLTTATAFGFINLTVLDGFDLSKMPSGSIKIQSSCEEDIRALRAWLLRAESAYFAEQPLFYNTTFYNCRHWAARNIYEGMQSPKDNPAWRLPYLSTPPGGN